MKSIEHAPFLNETTASAMEEKGLFLVTAVAPVFEVDVETARVTYPPASFAKWIKVREAAKNMVNVVAAHPNLKLAFGTDLLGTIDDIKVTDDKMNLEYGWWDEYIEPARILRGLTSTAAEINAMTGPMNPYTEGPQGVVEAGAYADLLLVDGNPLEDIDLLGDPDTNFKVIMKDGVIYKNTLGGESR